MNWETLRSQATETFKNPNFQFHCELGKFWKCQLRATFKSPNFEYMNELGKVMF